MSGLDIQTLVRAAQIVGGVEALARKLGISPDMLNAYLLGKVPVHSSVFLKASEIVTQAGIADAAVKGRANSKQADKKK